MPRSRTVLTAAARRPDRRPCIRATALLAVMISIAALFLATTDAAAAPRPHNPTDKELRQARIAKNQAAKEVGQVSAQIAAITAQIHALDAKAESAREALNYALWQLKQATDAAAAARKSVTAAQAQVDKARIQFGRYIRQSFMTAGNDTSGLLTGKDPNAVLQRSDLARYQASRQDGTISALNLATTQRSNADAKARTAKAKQQKLTDAAKVATQRAVDAANQAKSQKVGLQAQLTTKRSQLTSAGMRMTGLSNQRAAFDAWKAEEARKAAAAAAARARARAAAEAARQAYAAQQQAASAQGSSGSSGPPPSSGSPQSGTFSWTPAKGQAAVNRAMGMLGVPYSFAAGNKDGTTYGVCTPGDGGWNDCNVRGIDCSGLVMYAWSYLLGIDNMVHYTVWQYPNLGSFHPSPDQLMPGDLVFLSSDGSTGPNLHHVMIYIGNGNVIEAPYSGSQVHITPLYSEVGWFATRPGT